MKLVRNRKKRKWVLTVLFSLLLVFLIYIVGNMIYSQISNKVPSFMGYSIMNIISTSMEPEIPKNTFIIIKAIDPDKLNVDDVITFYSKDPNIKGLPNTHRIVDIEKSGDGLVFITKGDANAISDSYKVDEKDIIGVYQKNLVSMGKAAKLFQSKYLVFILLVVPATVLLIFEIINFTRTAKNVKNGDEKEEDKEDDTVDSTGKTQNEQDHLKKKPGFFKKLLYADDLEYVDDKNYQSLLRKNFYNYDQVRKKRQMTSLRITSMVLAVALIVFLALYLVSLNDSMGLLHNMEKSSMTYVYENVMYTDNDVKYTEVVSELNVMRTLMNHSGQPAKRQYAISELYYVAVQMPDSFVKHRSEVHDAFDHLMEGRLVVGYKQIEELLIKIIDKKK